MSQKKSQKKNPKVERLTDLYRKGAKLRGGRGDFKAFALALQEEFLTKRIKKEHIRGLMKKLSREDVEEAFGSLICGLEKRDPLIKSFLRMITKKEFERCRGYYLFCFLGGDLKDWIEDQGPGGRIFK